MSQASFSASPDELARSVGLAGAPKQWAKVWEDYARWRQAGGCPLAVPVLPPEAAALFDLPPEALPDLDQACERIRADEALLELAVLYHFLLYDVQPGGYLSEEALPLPHAAMQGDARLFVAAVMFAGARHAADAYARLGVPADVRDATLAQGGFYLREHLERYGCWGHGYPGWMRRHLRAEIFRLGRLIFNRARYTWPFRVYESVDAASPVALAEHGTRFVGGILCDRPDTSNTSEAHLAESPLAVEGLPVTPEGEISGWPVRLDGGGWRLVAAPGCEIIEVHITGRGAGGAFTEDACRDSYRQALGFFPRIYPGEEFPLFTCYSWLLDPALAGILSPESNIVRFQKAYHLLPMRGGDEQTFDLAFGCTPAEAATAPRNTSLQRAILDFIAAGGRMNSAAGYFTWKEAEKRYL